MSIELRALSLEDGVDVYNFLQELGPGENGFGNAAFGILREASEGDFRAYLRRQYDSASGENIADGFVPQTTYWLTADSEIVGIGKLRHRLNDRLRLSGGHIGYSIKPSARRRGYGTVLLRKLLREASKLGIAKVLLTIDMNNESSQAVALRNGAVLSDIVEGRGRWLIDLEKRF